MHIYGSYKATQLKAFALRAAGKTPEQLKEELWRPQHTWAGTQMFTLCITLRGFYLKVRLAFTHWRPTRCDRAFA